LPFSATEIQRAYRGWIVRHKDVLSIKRHENAARHLEDVELIYCWAVKNATQARLMKDLAEEESVDAATVIQAYWRRHAAKKQFKVMQEQILWPIKALFTFSATGVDAVRCQVNFMPNPSFEAGKYLDVHGTPESGRELSDLLTSMEDEVNLAVAKYLDNQLKAAAARRARAAAGESDLDTAEPSMDWLDSIMNEDSQTLDEDGGLQGDSLEVVNGSYFEDGEGIEGWNDGASDASGSATGGRSSPTGTWAGRSRSGEVFRTHYGGTFTNGRFYKNTITSLDQLSEQHKKEIMADLEDDRQRRVQELAQRQQKLAAREQRRQMKEAKRLQAARTQAAWRKPRLAADADATFRASTGLPPCRSLTDLGRPHSQRLDVNEKRRHLRSLQEEQHVGVGSPASRRWQLPAVTPPEQKDPQQLVHSHVHMHMHQYHEELAWKSKPTLPSLDARPKLQRSMSAIELMRPGGPGRGRLAAYGHVPFGQAFNPPSWTPMAPLRAGVS